MAEKQVSKAKASDITAISNQNKLLAVRYIIREELHNLQFLGFKDKDILPVLEGAKDDMLNGYQWNSDDEGIILRYKKLLSEHIENRKVE